MFKFINFLTLLTFTINLQANDNNATTLAQAEKWLSTSNEKGFLENKGQMMDNEGNPVPQVLFKTEAPDLNIWVTKSGLTIQTLRLRKEPIPESELSEFEKEEVKRTGKAKTKKYFDWERVDIDLKGSTIKKENILKENPLQGHDNYFYPTCPDGIYGVKEYEKITIKDVYPGIDWVLYRNKDKGFKYDFIVHPGANYQKIELIYKSKTPIKINKQGELEMFTIYGKVKENKPVSFYENQEVTTRFIQNYQKPTEISGDKGFETSISFSLNTSLNIEHSTLIIDPQLTWATFYGGNSHEGPMSVTNDSFGNLFVAGYISSFYFPIHNAGTFFQGTFAGGEWDAFILKFNNTGNRLWATFYGGNEIDIGNAVTTDLSGNVFVTGTTTSTNLPIQNAGTFFQGINAGDYDIFILKFDNNGNRLWATYYGGSGGDFGYSIITDSSNNIFLTGTTTSSDFPIYSTPFQGIYGGGFTDAFILKFDNSGNYLWSTYYGGSGGEVGYSVATDISNNVYITGMTSSINFPIHSTAFQGTYGGDRHDVFILKFDNFGNRLWATFYGGSEDDIGNSISTDNLGNVFVTGTTTSTNFPVQSVNTFFQGINAGGQDVFLLKFDNTGNRIWATYYGGSDDDRMGTYDNLAITSCGKVYMSFNSSSTVLPFQPPCDSGAYFDNIHNGGSKDVVLILFSNTGNLLWGTYIGGDGNDFREALSLDLNDNLFIVGEWTEQSGSINSANYPLTNPGGGAYFDNISNGGDDLYILKFCSNTCICGSYHGCLTCTETTLTQNFVECQGFSMTIGTNTYTTTGIFTDIINGCDTVITNLTINAAPQFTLIKEDDNCGEHIGSVLVNVTSSIPPVTYTWNTGSNDSIISNLPPGTYTVSVNDGSGCVKADIINVLDLKLDCEFFIFIPTVFTPNGDGQNDEFLIQLKGLEFISLEIYNRWGLKLFESTQENRGWDGRTNTGSKVVDGTYFFIVNYKKTDETMAKKGTFTLLR